MLNRARYLRWTTAVMKWRCKLFCPLWTRAATPPLRRLQAVGYDPPSQNRFLQPEPLLLCSQHAHVSSLSDMDGKNYTWITKEVCGSLWFARFARGCNRRMGQDWRPDQAISVDLEIALLAYVEIKIQTLVDPTELDLWSLAGAYFAFSFVLLLCGNEGLLVDLKAMIEHDDQHQNYVVIPLLGKVKGEHHVRQHLLPSVLVTDSGIRMGDWHHRVLETH